MEGLCQIDGGLATVPSVRMFYGTICGRTHRARCTPSQQGEGPHDAVALLSWTAPRAVGGEQESYLQWRS